MPTETEKIEKTTLENQLEQVAGAYERHFSELIKGMKESFAAIVKANVKSGVLGMEIGNMERNNRGIINNRNY